MKNNEIAYLLLFLSFHLELFAISSTTFTSDTEFQFFSKTNVTVRNEGSQAVLYLNNHFTPVSTVSRPLKRHSYDADFSTISKKVVLFGGINTENYPYTYLNDCWIFDETNKWTRLNISTTNLPLARYGHSFTYCGEDKFLLFGGLGENGVYFSDTYLFSLTFSSFQPVLTSTSPQARYYHSSCFVPNEKKVYIFGGVYQGIPLNDMWCFDLQTNNWQKISSTSTHPAARWGHKMVYVEKNNKIYIFGGQLNDITFLNDLWEFDLQTKVFTQVIPTSSSPTARTHFGMCYNPQVVDRIIIFGGFGTGNKYLNDLWMYNIDNKTFTQLDPTLTQYLSPPQARDKFSFINFGNKQFLFGGSNGFSPLDDSYFYYYSISGYFESDIVYIYNPTKLYYKQLTFSPYFTPQEVKFQISCSTDGKNFSPFLGPDGTGNTFFTVNAPNFSSEIFNNKPYIKIKGYLSTVQPPNNPYIDEIVLKYNRAPYAPVLTEPKNYTSTNTLTPTFYWQKPSDPDNDTSFSYRIQVAKTTDFITPVIDQAGIAEEKFTLSTSATLQTGVYYWRVSAKDADEGEFSSYFYLEIDTTAPSAVNYINAYTGRLNNQIVVRTYITGDDGYTNSLKGSVIVAYSSTTPILTEEDFNNAEKYEYFLPVPQQPGGEIAIIIDGLENNNTYFVNLKLKDDAGNLSEISTVTVYAITNFNPEIKINTPQNGSIISGDKVTISWYYSDFNPEDTHNFNIMLSTDNETYFAISPTLLDKTTYYVWNSLSVRNNEYYLKTVVVDQRGLQGSDTITVSVQNPNFPPKIVSWYKPQENEILTGTTKISWGLYDPNLADTHTYKLYISTDNKNFYLLSIFNDTTEYLFDTTQFYNGHNYKLKLEVTDGEFTDISTSPPFSIKNNNLPPTKPQLLLPKHLSYTSPYKIKFVWEEAKDPNPNDYVKYELYISTNTNFQTLIFSTTELKQTFYEIRYPIIEEQKSYYWYVKAKDIFDTETRSDIFMFTTLPRYKSISEDYKVYAELLDIPEEQIFIHISKLCDTSSRNNHPIISQADIKDKTDRFIKIIPYDVYEVNLYDENFNIVEKNLNYKLVFAYECKDVPAKNIKIAYIDKISNIWKFNNTKQTLTEPKLYGLEHTYAVETFTNVYGIYTVVAKDITYEPVSHIMVYPNPFDPNKEVVNIEYILTESIDLEVYILTLSGGLVKKFYFEKGINGKTYGTPEGERNSFSWDGTNDKGLKVATGMYLCKLVFGGKKNVYQYIGVVKK